mgnify:CR=1 FL=1
MYVELTISFICVFKSKLNKGRESMYVIGEPLKMDLDSGHTEFKKVLNYHDVCKIFFKNSASQIPALSIILCS